jgi:cyclic pyranopterin phosphate synthase
MPEQVFGREYAFLPREHLLSFEEIEHLVRIFASLGVTKLRLTGGEPLIRRGIETLISMLVNVPGIEDLAMITNGSSPLKRIQYLREAGLKRITVSLDSLDDEVFKVMNGVEFKVQSVLDWISASDAAGFAPIKVNMVVKRGVNESSILPMARYFRTTGHILRFIEYMDVGGTNQWRMSDVVTASEILAKVNTEMPLEPIEPNYYGEVAKRWRYKDGSGEIGLISSVTQPFCGSCTRTRLSADGTLYTCLFASKGHDLRTIIRSGATDDEVSNTIRSIWLNRSDRYSEIRFQEITDHKKIKMSYIGG